MAANRPLFRVAWRVCAALSVLVLMTSLFGCHKKQADAGYGPGYEWVDDMRDRIVEDVDDPDSAAGLLGVVDEIEQMLIELDQELRSYYDRLSALDQDYNSTREQFEDLMTEFGTKRDAYYERFLGYQFQMKKIAGREYWDEVSDIDTTLMESWRRPYTGSGG